MKEHVLVVQHPVFLRCCQFLSDPFWVFLFEDMAYGKCPYGVVIQDECMYCILRGREFTYSLQQSKSPEEICNDLCHILSTKLNILSQQDHFRFRDECQVHTKNYMEGIHSWNDIRKKNLKDVLLEKYSLTQKAKYDYTNRLTHTLFAVIFIGLQFKTILHRQIEYHHHTVQKIHGITCEPRRIVCAYNVFITKTTTNNNISNTSNKVPRRSVSTSTMRMSHAWKRYLLSLLQ